MSNTDTQKIPDASSAANSRVGSSDSSAPSFSTAYRNGYETAKRGSFYRPNPYPTCKEAATAWDRGYEAFQFEQRRADARIKHAQSWADCRE